jgi:predicted ester cyclase
MPLIKAGGRSSSDLEGGQYPGWRSCGYCWCMSTEENKALIRHYIEAIDENNSSDWSMIDEFVAEDFVAHNQPIPGVGLDRDGLKQAAESFRVATPGKHEIPLQVAERDLVVSRIVGRGVHAGELLGISPTNREVETDGVAIHRIRDGKIVEYWSVVDVARVLQQVGALPGPH